MDDDQCMVCLNACRDEDRLWTCSCCHKKCHMLCTFQWTLRLSLNQSRRVSAYTCPGCRTSHAITTLPGFEQHAEPSHRSGNASTADILRRVFGVTSLNATESDEEEDTEEDTEEDEDEDEDDSYTEGDRCLLSVSTEKIYIDVDTLTININTHTHTHAPR